MSRNLNGNIPDIRGGPKGRSCLFKDLQHEVRRLGAAGFVADRSGSPCQPRVSLAPWSGAQAPGAGGAGPGAGAVPPVARGPARNEEHGYKRNNKSGTLGDLLDAFPVP